MRNDPARLEFEITARDGAARTGRLLTAHGPVRTPAFIPLATRGAVRSLDLGDVAGLGFELILGNTFHLFISPGAERIAQLGGLHRFMGWERSLITDSGGFQVFSLAHGNVADEIKGRRRGAGSSGGVVEISERGVAFRSYLDGSERFMGPEESMAVQAALASDIALAFDECTPYHADRDYTARSTERTHRWLERCLEWHAAHGPERQAVFGIVQGGVYEDLRRESAEAVAAAGVDGIAIGGTLGRDKPEMHGVLAMTAPMLPPEAPEAPARDRRARRPARRHRARDRRLRLRRAHPPRAPRHGAGAASRRPLSLRRGEGRLRHRRGPAGRGLSVPDLRRPHPRLPALPERAPRRRPPPACSPCTTSPSSSAWSPARARRSPRVSSPPTASGSSAAARRGRCRRVKRPGGPRSVGPFPAHHYARRRGSCAGPGSEPGWRQLPWE